MEYTDISIELGINYDQLPICCPNGNQMMVHRGIVTAYFGPNREGFPQCDKCDQHNLNMQELFYVCSNKACDCQFDLCRSCALTNAGAI